MIDYLVKDGNDDQYVPVYPFHQETYELPGDATGSNSLANKNLCIAVTVNITDTSLTYPLLQYNYFSFFSKIEISGELHTFPIGGQNTFTWTFDHTGELTFYLTLRPNVSINTGSPTLIGIQNIITAISLPYGMEYLPASFFAGILIPNVDIILPSSIKQVQPGCFGGCSLRKLVIPKNCVVSGSGMGGLSPEILEFHGTYINLNTVFGTNGSSYLGLNVNRLKKIIIDCKNTKVASCNGMSQCEEVEVSGNVDTIYSGCFAANSNIKKVTLSGNKLKVIQGGAFSGCTKLEDISIADSVEDILGGTFGGCTSLKYLKMPASLKVLRSGVINSSGMPLETIVLQEGLEEIQFAAINGISTLKNVNIPSTITAIPSACFVNCTGLESIDIPDSITSIGDSAFALTSLTEISIPDSVTSIGIDAFNHCKLRKIYVPNNVTSVGNGAFAGNQNTLEEVYIDTDAIAGTNATTNPTTINVLFPYIFGYSNNHSNLKKVELGPHVTVIGNSAFWRMSTSLLIEIIFGESVKNIKINAFYETCPKNELDLSNVEVIESYAFYRAFNNNVLKTIRLNNIRNIGFHAMLEVLLENLIIDSQNITEGSMNEYAFYQTRVYDTLYVNANISFGTTTYNWLTNVLSWNTGYVKNIILGDLVYNDVASAYGYSQYTMLSCTYAYFGKNILVIPVSMFLGNPGQLTVEHNAICIDNQAFMGCYRLQQFNTSTIKYYRSRAFAGSSLGGTIQVPSDGTVGYLAFSGTNITRFICKGTIDSSAYPLTACTNLEYIEVDSGLNRCVDLSFSQLTSLKEIVTNDSVIGYIGGFPALEKVTLTNPQVGFNQLNTDVFTSSPNLKDVYIYNKTAPTLRAGMFANCAENVKVHVPANATGYEAWVDGSTPEFSPYILHWEIVKDLPAQEDE